MSGQITPSTRPTPLQLLQKLEDAYGQLLTGQQVASIRDENGEQVTYSVSNMPMMLQTMTTLATKCPGYDCPYIPNAMRHQAIGFFF